MVSITQDMLERLTTRLVEALQPERIYLFGSRAYGSPDVDSDLDLLLVVPESNGRRIDVARAARRLIRDLPCPVDVIVRYPDEFDRRSAWPTTIEATAKLKGLLLYG